MFNGIIIGVLMFIIVILVNGMFKFMLFKYNYFELKWFLLMRIYVIEINFIIYKKRKINLLDVLYFNFGLKEFDIDWL